MNARYKNFGCLVIAIIPGAVAPQGWQPHVGEPPVDDAMHLHPGTILDLDPILGIVTTNLSEKTVNIKWFKDGAESNYQRFPTSYYPTAVTSDGARLVIAGKRPRGGNTVIETWDFNPPLVLTPDPPGSPGMIMPTTASSIETVYDEATQGRDMIRLMTMMRQDVSDSVMVQFYDSHDLFIVNYADVNNVLVNPLASATPLGAPLHIPTLGTAGWDLMYRGNHAVHGQLYFLTYMQPPSLATALVLEDSNRDGIVEGFSIVNGVGWEAGGYGSGESYLDMD